MSSYYANLNRFLLTHCLSHGERLGLAKARREAAHRQKDPIAEARALHQLGICYSLAGNSAKAGKVYQKALRQLKSLRRPDTAVDNLRASVEASRGWHYIDVAAYAQAIPILQNCLQVLKKHGEVYDEMYAVEGLGEAIMRIPNGDAKQARKHFHRIRARLDRQYGSQRTPTLYDILALRGLGWSYSLEGQPRKGITPCWQAVKLARDVLKHPRIESIARSRLAFCLWKAGKINASIVEYLRALNLATEWSLGGRVEVLADLWAIAIQTKRTDMANWTARLFLSVTPINDLPPRPYEFNGGWQNVPERTQNFVIEGYVDPTEPLRDEGPFGDRAKCEARIPKCERTELLALIRHSSFGLRHSLHPAFHFTGITHRQRILQACCAPSDAIVYVHDNNGHRKQSSQHPAGHCAGV